MAMRVFKILLLCLLAASVLLLPGLGLADKQTIVYGTTEKVESLDPHILYNIIGLEMLDDVYPFLVEFKPGTTELVPELATSWSSNEDSTEWTFQLREGLAWPDGTPFDAKAVKHSIERAIKLAGPPSWLVSSFVDRVEILGPYEVKFVLKKAAGYFPTMLPHTVYTPVNPNQYPLDEARNFPSELPGGKIEGLGRYNIVSFKRDEECIFEANPNYWGEKPKNDRFVMRFFADSTTLRLSLEKGEMDLVFQFLNPSDIADMEKEGKFKAWKYDAPYIREICFNCDTGPFKDKVLRQAVAAAIDRKPMIEKVFLGQMIPSYSFMPISWKEYYIPAFEERYGPDGNLDMAKELLASRGYTPENKMEVDLWYTPTVVGPTEIDLATMTKTQLEATGAMTVKVQSVEWAGFVQKWMDKEMPIFLLGFYPDYTDPDACMGMAHSEAGSAFGIFYANDEWDAKMAEAGALTDPAKRAPIYHWLQQDWAIENPMLPLFQGFLTAFSQKNIEGVGFAPIGSLLYHNIHRAE